MNRNKSTKIINYLCTKDKKFKLLVKEIGYIYIEDRNLDFLSLVKIIISQQLSTIIAGVIFDRFTHLFSKKNQITPENLLQIDRRYLKESGISFSKIHYIRNLALVLTKKPNLIEKWKSLDDENALCEIQKLVGFGSWSANIILLFYFGRLDIFPHTDATIKKVYVGIYKKEFSEDLREVLWARPYRSVLARYLWAWKDTVGSFKGKL
tara:strand:+ start:557 stop:1180 length:624 start_codon:yes stop_codon:yes gene_type:complete